MTYTATYPNSPDSVRSARYFTHDVLGQHRVPEERRAVAELLVSELATNAIRHATSGFELAIDVKAATIHIGVTDTGDGRPALKRPEPNQPNGRGLLIVESISDAWGTTADGASKTVWCNLSTRMPTRSGH